MLKFLLALAAGGSSLVRAPAAAQRSGYQARQGPCDSVIPVAPVELTSAGTPAFVAAGDDARSAARSLRAHRSRDDHL